MKLFRRSFLLIACVGALALTVGCASPQTSVNPDTLQKDLRTAARVGSREAMRMDPNSLPYLQAAYSLMDATATGNADVNVLSDALSKISVKELRDPTVVEGITAAVDLLQNHLPDLIAKFGKNSPYVFACVAGIRDGIGDVLGITPHTQPPALPMKSSFRYMDMTVERRLAWNGPRQ